MPSPQVVHMLEHVLDDRLPLVPMSGTAFDHLLAGGWRVLGYCLLRHNFASWDGQLVGTIPLRICLDGFSMTKSQRRTLRRHADLRVTTGPITLTPEKERLCEMHAIRFRSGGYTSMEAFLTPDSARLPVPGLEFQVFEEDRLLACSYLHVGKQSVSATYCFFDPGETKRSLGHFTMLLEMAWAQRMGKRHYYHGYCHSLPSQFDYKRRFQQLERYDWAGRFWAPF